MYRFFILIILGISVFTMAFAAESIEQSQKLPLTPQLQKEIIPWFTARDMVEQNFSRKDLENTITPQTKRVALALFASWCIPCREGIVRLRNSQAELDKNGVQVILVNTGENDLSKIESWVKENGSDKWLIIIDKFKNLQKNTGLITDMETEIVFPKTILLDKNLKPLLLIGTEGKDWPNILWE